MAYQAIGKYRNARKIIQKCKKKIMNCWNEITGIESFADMFGVEKKVDCEWGNHWKNKYHNARTNALSWLSNPVINN